MDEPHLPMERSRFIGRQRDLQELRDLVGRQGLVTLTGPPGVGKTRLAVHLGWLESRHFADGATFLDLAGVTADELVAAEIAEQLGLSLDSSGNAVSSLAVALEARHVLLILDNCEHVLDGAARVCAGILGRCPGVRIVATSREPLRIEGEVLWQLAPLELPPPGASLHELRRAGSAALFADRASAREPNFSLSEPNRADVVAICAAVDGLPLALELAAALVGSLTLADIALGLQREIGLLVRGGRLVDRHRTLRSAIDWSYSLLSEPEQAVLLRLSVFPGAFDLAAAAAVCAGGMVPGSSVVSHVVGLAEKSLVQAAPHEGHTRYRLLVPMRQYCLERIGHEDGSVDGAESARMRHLLYCLSLAEAAEPSLMSGHREASLKALGLEIHNIRAALECGLSSSEVVANDGAARLAAALLWFWCIAGRTPEGMSWLERAEKLRDRLPIETQARVLYSGGEIAWLLGEEALGRAWLEESADIWRSLGERRRVAYCLQALSFLVDPELGREQAEESMAIFRATGDEWGGALALHTLGMIESQRGCAEEGRAKLEEALRQYRVLGDRYLATQALNHLGDLARNENEYETARQHYEAALAVQETSGFGSSRASLLQNLGFVSLHLGDRLTALGRFREAVQLFVEQGDSRGVAEGLIGVAVVLTADDDRETAAMLAGAAGRMLAESGATLWRSNRDDAGTMTRTLKARLGDERFEALTGQGASLGLQDAMKTALGKAPAPSRSTVERAISPLTPREQEVAALVAKGYRNREIAEALVISEGTANLHVKHILRRLRFSSRSEIAAWAAGQGLPNPVPK